MGTLYKSDWKFEINLIVLNYYLIVITFTQFGRGFLSYSKIMISKLK